MSTQKEQTDQPIPKMTAAEHAVQTLPKMRIWISIIGGAISIAMIISGYCLTQRQLRIEISEKITEVEVNLQKEEFKLKSTYPGLVFIICGTVIATVVLGKGFYFMTKQTNKKTGEPGATEIKC